MKLQAAHAFVRAHPILTGVLAAIVALTATLCITTSVAARRASEHFAALAHEANEAGRREDAIRFALLGVSGHDTPLFGFDARAARGELLRAMIQSRAVAVNESGAPRGGAFSRDGRRIAAALYDFNDAEPATGVIVLDAISGREIVRGAWPYSAETQPVGAGFSPNGELVAATFNDGAAIFRLSDGALLRRLSANAPLTSQPVFNTDGALAAAAGEGRLFVWDAVYARLLATFDLTCGRPAFVAGTDHLRAACADGFVHTWSMDGYGEVSRVRLQSAGQNIPDMSADGARAELVAPNGAFVWSAQTDARTAHIAVSFRHSFHRQIGAFSADGRRVAIGGHGEGVHARVFDLARGQETMVLHSGYLSESAAFVAFSPDGTSLATSVNGDPIIVWDVGAAPDPDRQVAPPEGDARALTRLSTRDLARLACEINRRQMALYFNRREAARAQAIWPAAPYAVCLESPLLLRIRAAFGLLAPEATPEEEDDGGLSTPPDAVRIAYRFEGGVDDGARSTVWIEARGARMGRRDANGWRQARSIAYWDGRSTFIRNGDDVRISTPFLTRNFFHGLHLVFDTGDRHEPAEQNGLASVRTFVSRAGVSEVAGRPCTLWRSENVTNDVRIVFEVCVWNGMILSEARRYGSTVEQRVAVEVVEGERIPDDIRALAETPR